MLNSDEIAHIANYLDTTTVVPSKADLIWVFGTALATPAHLAADLYAAGRAPRVVLTGGANRRTGLNEAETHGDMLRQRGVPREALIVENCSTNTLENVLFALPLLAESVAIATIEAILIVAKWHHSRRAMMTLRRHLPEGITYYAATYEPEGIARAGWHLTEQGLRSVQKEWASIPHYLQIGHIAEVRGDASGYR